MKFLESDKKKDKEP